jgi:hypothetical protein
MVAGWEVGKEAPRYCDTLNITRSRWSNPGMSVPDIPKPLVTWELLTSTITRPIDVYLIPETCAIYFNIPNHAGG